MIDPANVPDVEPRELLARYVLFSKHIRSNHTLKPDAFMPHPRMELSVTRHLMATETELLSIGKEVAAARTRTLYGRGDVQAVSCQQLGLSVKAAPLAENPNHANVGGWPSDKPAQKNISQEIAAASTFVSADP